MRVTTLAFTLILIGGISVGARISPAQQAVKNPHGSLTVSCAACHAPQGWVPARVTAAFDHSKTGFVLAGSHAAVSCRSCHASLDFKSAPRDCASCHRDVHHGELGADCVRCHTPRNFLDRSTMVRAHQETRFPLNGAHIALNCDQCHRPAPQGQFAFVNRSTECVSCHLAAFTATSNPNHQAGGFSTNCTQCHSTGGWPRARFNHAGTQFPLTGAHAPLTCNQCHGDGVYAGKSNTCVSCHQAAYDGTTNPSHAALQFPTDCVSCHTTSAWHPAGFASHDAAYFPIYSGAHRGKWSSCATCHTAVTDYSQFTCLTCHEQRGTDEHHREVSGYSYTSQACYSCHSNGRKP